MQPISSLTLSVCEQCNFSCSYCPQPRGSHSLRFEDARIFLDFLRPRLADEVWLGFYGGEPLLKWPLVERTVDYLQAEGESRFRFAMTTNGSLLQKERIHFFRENRFELVLSYDGLAQKARDPGSVAAVEASLADLLQLYPEGYVVNSVFTPQTVSMLAASLEELLRQGHSRLEYSLDTGVPWEKTSLAALDGQLQRLATIAAEHNRETGTMPLENFRRAGKKGIFACFAGSDRLALLPDRTVWGCDMFHTLLGRDPRKPDYPRYCFGRLEDFTSMPAQGMAAISANYSELRQDYFFSETGQLCSLCPDLEHCAVCPATAALATRALAVIPSWTCRIKKITRAAAARFHYHTGNGCNSLDKRVQ
jgi:sulfatase maturation enzyme AslB (radical SAM superfamily)